MIHIICGDEAAKNLEAAFELDENLRGEIFILKDQLSIGPITVPDPIDHDVLRTEFWKRLQPTSENISDDHTRISELVAKALSDEEPLCFWLSPCANDVSAYYWLLPYTKPYPELLHTINVIGLPFLNEKGQMFYPKNFSEVPPKEFVKTKRLLKEVTPAEYEVEGDEWAKLQNDSTWVRTYEGGKKLASRPETFFDNHLLQAATTDFQKASKVIQEAAKKIIDKPDTLFLEYRLRNCIHEQRLVSQGDLQKTTRDFEVKKAGEQTELSL